MTQPIRIAVVGIGKIATDQHLPAIAADSGFELVATVTRSPTDFDRVPNFRDIDGLVAAMPDVQAVSLCTPPVGRHAIARAALAAGLHVMLEKPPGAAVSEIADLVALARTKHVSLFATWHVREAPAVEPARAWLEEQHVVSAAIRWREDVRRWHPGQAWIWEPGGLGVFDPGINALSVATAILPGLFLTGAELSFPAGRQTPIAATLALTDAAGTPVTADFDWRETGEQVWEIRVETDAGPLWLSDGGAKLAIDGKAVIDEPAHEYPALYRRFAGLVASGQSDVDLTPFQIAADAFMLGRRVEVAAFDD